MGQCFTVPENTRHPSLSPEEQFSDTQNTQTKNATSTVNRSTANHTVVSTPDNETQNEGKNESSTAIVQPRPGLQDGRSQNAISHLTKIKDYSSATAAMHEEENKYKSKSGNDAEIVYADDGVTIASKPNGAIINEYGQQRFDDVLVRDQVLDDILIT